ncbi:hypothetical protein EG68_01301 [Paragonimus skrjabini miyazakii]|uniref:Uncharacterized protein n=1 Tax=Paragonimus skrjabini miyazakii TaxID=59628 RepID=A0A8S9Z9P1_9TREM|nr:hypothetical protein EG68_01301 [Paragonimus skrjabini miyazakii]
MTNSTHELFLNALHSTELLQTAEAIKYTVEWNFMVPTTMRTQNDRIYWYTKWNSRLKSIWSLDGGSYMNLLENFTNPQTLIIDNVVFKLIQWNPNANHSVNSSLPTTVATVLPTTTTVTTTTTESRSNISFS